METVLLVISVLALAVAIVALVISFKKQTVKVVKETQTVEKTPLKSPFSYDEKNKVYELDGSLLVKGSVSCLASK